MAVYYLKHPIHGTKVACADFEKEADLKLGWKEYDPTKKEVPIRTTSNENLGRTSSNKKSNGWGRK